jgi:hypothetical protein
VLRGEDDFGADVFVVPEVVAFLERVATLRCN